MREHVRLIATCFTVIVIALIGAYQFRYAVTVKDNGALRYDRWTGRMSTCTLEQCVDINEYAEGSPSFAKDKRSLTVTFIDGSQLLYRNAPLIISRQDVIKRAERETGKRVSDVCCFPNEINDTATSQVPKL